MFFSGFYQGDLGTSAGAAQARRWTSLKGRTLYIRKIAAAASLATGAALALAPFAHADIQSTVLDTEISIENHIFETEALLAGQDDVAHRSP